MTVVLAGPHRLTINGTIPPSTWRLGSIRLRVEFKKWSFGQRRLFPNETKFIFGEGAILAMHTILYERCNMVIVNIWTVFTWISIPNRNKTKQKTAPTRTPQNDINTLRLRQNGRHFADDTFNAFSWMKMLEFRLTFHWSLFLRV